MGKSSHYDYLDVPTDASSPDVHQDLARTRPGARLLDEVDLLVWVIEDGQVGAFFRLISWTENFELRIVEDFAWVVDLCVINLCHRNWTIKGRDGCRRVPRKG